MTDFVPLYSQRLFTAHTVVGDLLIVLPTPTTSTSISLSTAWTSSGMFATFVYASAGVEITSQETAELFVDAVLARVDKVGASRGFLWLQDTTRWEIAPIDDGQGRLWGMAADGSAVLDPLVVDVAPGLLYVVNAGASLSLSTGDTASIVKIGGALFGYTDDHAPVPVDTILSATLALDGLSVGTIQYQARFTTQSLNDACSWGFQFAHPTSGGGSSHWLPLAAKGAPDAIGFTVAFDPSSPLNNPAVPMRSRLTFTGYNDANNSVPTVLTSGFRTQQGTAISLTPVANTTALVFDRGAPGRSVTLSPLGEFQMSTTGIPTPATLMCGMQGTEGIVFQPGDRLSFTPYCAAYAPQYPFAVASPVAAPSDPSVLLLDSTYTTSWAGVVGAGKKLYVAQPKGAPFYGLGDQIYQNAGVLGWMDLTTAMPLDLSFPMAPYGLAAQELSASAAADFERQIIAPRRRQIIGAPATTADGSAEAVTSTTTTPSGQIVTITDSRWTRILLGQTSAQQTLSLLDPKPTLQQAFQTAGLFLVAANAASLGAFQNTVEIDGWQLTANVGSSNAYGDYRNVVIVKGRTGKLTDLVANPDSWTQSDFAIPTEPAPDGSFTSRQRRELVILSQWLQDFLADAAARKAEADYARFNSIASDPLWTGTLFLRVDIDKVPDDLIGIMAGIADPTGFNAHHLGIEITPLTATANSNPSPAGSSSMFGLIDYTDPSFTRPRGGLAVKPVRPAVGTAYDFRLLSLQVSFANTAVRKFASYAQLTASSWFDMPVDHMGDSGNRFCALVLTGTLQTNNGQPIYSLATTEDAQFYFANDIVRKIEITSVIMSTRNSGEADDLDREAGSWFGLSGFLDFEVVYGPGPDGDQIALDLFSFGSDPGFDQMERGLAFSNLGILMTFPIDSPQDRVFSFETGQTQFDIATSTPRDGSLFRQFALEVRGLVSGGVLTPPARAGYLAVTTDARLSGVARGAWWGIDYQLSMGTAGHLAGQAGLNAHLLTAWSPRRSRRRNVDLEEMPEYEAAVGLKLPGTGGGAKLISLQSVLRLSIGQLWLRYDVLKGAFMLLMSEIALKVLGLGSLPPGSTLFYLYGNPHDAESPSGLGWYAMYRREGIGA